MSLEVAGMARQVVYFDVPRLLRKPGIIFRRTGKMWVPPPTISYRTDAFGSCESIGTPSGHSVT
jgi:hypothetical protein